MNNIFWRNKKIAILGFGIENHAVLEWLIKHGMNNITICDKNDKLFGSSDKFSIFNFQFSNNFQLTKSKFPNIKIQYQLGKDYLKNLREFDVIFRTPGIPYLTPEIQSAKKSGTIITSGIKLFLDLCPAKTIGVTGTKGKGTTTALISEILKRNFQFPTCLPVGKVSNFQTSIKNQIPKTKIYTGGNIGSPPIEFLDRLHKDDWVVLELSSFQLQDLEKSPHIAVILDIRQDHLDHHQSIAEYVGAKANIVKFQSKNDYVVVNLDYLKSFAFALLSSSENEYYFSRRKSVDLGAFVKWDNQRITNQVGEIILSVSNNEFIICKTNEVTLRGEHNLENICAAIIASYLAGASIEAIRQEVKKFKGLEHRLEFVKEIKGVRFYDDSIATTPETTMAAINSFNEPKILILGGRDKGANYFELVEHIEKNNVKAVIVVGEVGPDINSKFKIQNSKLKTIIGLLNMEDIVKAAFQEAKKGDVILLSPGASSKDMFENYKDRGEQFKLAVANLGKILNSKHEIRNKSK